MFDCAIIGTGAAGVSAALTLKSLNKKIIWFGESRLSSKIRNAEKIRNYPGLSSVSGEELTQAFLNQVRDMGISITDKRVTGVYPMGGSFGILCDQEMFEAKTVILTTGVEAVKPISGELEFVGKGVSYCATCDGFLYKDKTIAVVCTSKDLEHEIEFLATLAKKVYAFTMYKGVDIKAENVEIVKGFPKAVVGTKKVEKLALADRELEVDGVFMLKAAVAPSVLVHGLEAEEGHVKVNRAMNTNIAGCFAAGDCTGRPYQYAKAVGEGNVAAHSVNEYLSSVK